VLRRVSEADAVPRAPATGGIVVADRVLKTYETAAVVVKALKGVSLQVQCGEMVAVMGPSGCGKTTLLNCLSSIDDLSGGEVYIEGRPLTRLSDNAKTDFRAQKMGFIFQSYNLLPVLTAAENVEMPLLLQGHDPRKARKRAAEVLEAVGLRGEAGKKPSEMSGGQQQRVAIARSLVNRPAIVFGDEPTGNLDSETTAEVMDLLQKLNRDFHQTFIVVTHDAVVGGICHRIIRMRSGRIEDEVRPGA